MTSLIRARWTRVKSTPPPPLRLLLLVFGMRREGRGERTNFERIFKRIGLEGRERAERLPTGSKLLISICFAPASLAIICQLSHPPPMNFCPHGFDQKLDVLATISVLVWKTALFDLAMIVAAPQLRMTWFFFFVFREEEEGRREGRSMKIVTANRRGWWKWEAMRWTVTLRGRGRRFWIPPSVIHYCTKGNFF